MRKQILIFSAGLLIGALSQGVYTTGESAAWRLNRWTGEQRVCTAFTGVMTCYESQE